MQMYIRPHQSLFFVLPDRLRVFTVVAENSFPIFLLYDHS